MSTSKRPNRPIKYGVKKNYTGRVDFTVEMSDEEIAWFEKFFLLLSQSVALAKEQESRENAGAELSKFIGINLDSKKLFTFHQGWCRAAKIDKSGITFDARVWDSPANAKPLIEFLDFFFFNPNAIIKNIGDMDFIHARSMNGHIIGKDESGEAWEYVFEASIAYEAKGGQKTELSQKRLSVNYFQEFVEKAKLHALINKSKQAKNGIILKI